MHLYIYLQWRIQDFPLGECWPHLGGGANLWHRHFSAETCAKMKELGPIDGGGEGAPWIRHWLVMRQNAVLIFFDLCCVMSFKIAILVVTISWSLWTFHHKLYFLKWYVYDTVQILWINHSWWMHSRKFAYCVHYVFTISF